MAADKKVIKNNAYYNLIKKIQEQYKGLEKGQRAFGDALDASPAAAFTHILLELAKFWKDPFTKKAITRAIPHDKLVVVKNPRHVWTLFLAMEYIKERGGKYKIVEQYLLTEKVQKLITWYRKESTRIENERIREEEEKKDEAEKEEELFEKKEPEEKKVAEPALVVEGKISIEDLEKEVREYSTLSSLLIDITPRVKYKKKVEKKKLKYMDFVWVVWELQGGSSFSLNNLKDSAITYLRTKEGADYSKMTGMLGVSGDKAIQKNGAHKLQKNLRSIIRELKEPTFLRIKPNDRYQLHEKIIVYIAQKSNTP